MCPRRGGVLPGRRPLQQAPQERRALGQEQAPTPPAEDVALLTEIRDLLANGTRPTSGTRPTNGTRPTSGTGI